MRKPIEYYPKLKFDEMHFSDKNHILVANKQKTT